MESHLLQMRGLKPNGNPRYAIAYKSHLLQMRGLKQQQYIYSKKTMGRIFYRCVD